MRPDILIFTGVIHKEGDTSDSNTSDSDSNTSDSNTSDRHESWYTDLHWCYP